MMIASGLHITLAVLGAAVVACGIIFYLKKLRAKRIAPWKLLRNGMTGEEVRALLGQPRKVIPIDGGENWDYGVRPYESTVQFTDGKVTGYIKPF
ncbi:MAG: hypothetical protein EHM48_09480 [Planctomycetaceae bacterium]|nr:MAG: hypothetical protein EHM48_09480 [Planctomycetaceae bacterium]